MSTDPAVHVMAAVIFNEDGEVLLSRRPDHVHLGGMWEFPGGKVEPGETAERALSRELSEELGIELKSASPLIRVPFTYPEKRVLLDVWRVTAYRGSPDGMEGQELVWVAEDQLSQWDMPPADRPIVAAIQLPNRYLITPEPGGNWDSFLEALEAALGRGIRLLQLRANQLSDDAYRELAAEVLNRCRDHGAQLLLNRNHELVAELGADGVHLSSSRLRRCSGRPLDQGLWVAASCHDPQELALAQRIKADFAVLGPVQTTITHPDVVPLGWERFGTYLEDAAIPVYALGGLSEEDIELSQKFGGQGISAIRGLWGNTET